MKEAEDMTHKELAKNLLLGKIQISYHANGKKKYEYRKEDDGHTRERYWNEDGELVNEIFNKNRIETIYFDPPFNTKLKNT